MRLRTIRWVSWALTAASGVVLLAGGIPNAGLGLLLPLLTYTVFLSAPAHFLRARVRLRPVAATIYLLAAAANAAAWICLPFRTFRHTHEVAVVAVRSLAGLGDGPAAGWARSATILFVVTAVLGLLTWVTSAAVVRRDRGDALDDRIVGPRSAGLAGGLGAWALGPSNLPPR